MLTSAKIAKQNGDTRTRKSEPGYLNPSNIILYYLRYISRDQNSSYDDKSIYEDSLEIITTFMT